MLWSLCTPSFSLLEMETLGLNVPSVGEVSLSVQDALGSILNTIKKKEQKGEGGDSLDVQEVTLN